MLDSWGQSPHVSAHRKSDLIRYKMRINKIMKGAYEEYMKLYRKPPSLMLTITHGFDSVSTVFHNFHSIWKMPFSSRSIGDLEIMKHVRMLLCALWGVIRVCRWRAVLSVYSRCRSLPPRAARLPPSAISLPSWPYIHNPQFQREARPALMWFDVQSL